MKRTTDKASRKKSIFRALFVPLFIIMLLQAILFYMATVYGGVEETLNNNAADILAERLDNRKNEIETSFVNDWSDLDVCTSYINNLYAQYLAEFGELPLADDAERQVKFVQDASEMLIKTLRENKVNGIFLILNNNTKKDDLSNLTDHVKIGICIRDLDQNSNYTAKEDLIVERAPSSVVSHLGCPLDSWWEARYSFSEYNDGLFYYKPLNAAWDNPGVDNTAIAYFQPTHRVSGSDQAVVSYSIPLVDEQGYPFAVLGVELTTKYLSSLIHSEELNDDDKGMYILAMRDINTDECTAVVGTGALYNRCFGADATFSVKNESIGDGFELTGRDGTSLYGNLAKINIYDNNNPFENIEFTLVGLVESESMFSYIDHIKLTLASVSIVALVFGLIGMLFVSRHFSRPITQLATKVKSMSPKNSYSLERLGIVEIDQLVDSIEELNKSVSRNIARTEFFSRMSHDMRTPMNAIISFSSPELLEDADAADREDYFKKIHKSGEYLLGLINEVLDMTKIESNKVDIEYEPVSASRLWSTILPIVDELAYAKDIVFEKELVADETATLLVDEQHLNQVVLNLLSNAIKFTQSGGRVRFASIIKENSLRPDSFDCEITVSDNGIGIGDDFLEKLYQPFEQEHDGKGGTGLGLSIAKKLIELMGGTIQCESSKNGGTTFHVNISMEKYAGDKNGPLLCSSSSAVCGNVAAAQRASKLCGKKILVLEDQPMNTQIIVKLLQREHMQVACAENGKIGLEIFRKSELGEYDAILMDIRMPVMDGLKASEEIRKLERPDAASIPIIAMTANAFAEDIAASLAAGMNAHLSKPVEPQKLYDTLAMMIQQ